MSNYDIVVNDYKYLWGTTENLGESEVGASREYMQRLERIIRDNLKPDDEVRKADVFNLRGERHNHNAGNRQRLCIYFDSEFLEKPSDLMQIHDGDVLVAEFSERTNEINIVSQVTRTNTDESLARVAEILTLVHEKVYKEKALRYSYIHSDRREALIKEFSELITERERRSLNDEKERERHYRDSIDDFKRRIRESYDNLIHVRRRIEALEKGEANGSEKVIKELELIKQHPLVKDIHIRGRKISVFTDDIYAYGSNDGERYYIGQMEIRIDIARTDVRFFNTNNTRHGYWTPNDPHPHVDGGSGNPCLGNVASTIAELCSQNELYALALVAMDFLENANQSDPAGARVRMWDVVDDEGNVIREGGAHDEETWTCDCCGDTYSEEHDEMHHVYNNAEGEEVYDEAWVCGECREYHYYYSEYYDEVVHEDVIEPEEEEE